MRPEAQPPPRRSLTITTDRATLVFLHAFSEEARNEGVRLHNEGCVRQIFGNHLVIEGRVQANGELIRTRLKLEGDNWVGISSTMKDDCAALYATMLERIDRGENLPETPNEVGEQSIQELLEKALGRSLPDEEEQYLAKVERRYRRYEMEGTLFDHDLVRLSSKWEVRGYDPLELWPVKPANILEFWNYVAHAFQKRNVRYPKFMDAITDLAATQERVHSWEREREIQEWRDRIGEGAKLAPALEVEEIDLRLMITTTEGRLQARRSRALAPGEAPRDGSFENIDGKEEMVELVERQRAGGLRMALEADHLWTQFRQYWETSQNLDIRLDQRQGAELLGHLLRQPGLRHRLVTLDETEFLYFEEPLRWVCQDEGLGGQAFALRLVDHAGEVIPHSLRLLPGLEPLYLSDEAVFRGPVEWAGLEVLPEYDIPADALATPEGVEFLAKIGATLPDSLLSQVDELPMLPAINVRLQGKPGSDAEFALLSVVAEDADGLRREEFRKDEWRITKQPARMERLTLFNRRWLYRFPFLIEPITSSWDVQQEAFRVRLTKNFASRFHSWALALPSEVKLGVDDRLQSLLDGAIEASVRFDLQERETDWFDLRVHVDAEGLKLADKELRLLVAARGDFVRMPDGRWMRLDLKLGEEQRKAIEKLGIDPFDLSGETHRMHVLQLAHGGKEIFDPEIWERIRERTDSLQLQVRPPLPAELTNVTLRPYQVEGFQFLAYLATNHFGGILADDMGLGKTLQSLCWVLWLRGRFQDEHPPPALVVCPKSVLDVWAGEVKKFASGLRIQVLRNKEELEPSHLDGGVDLLVTNYAQLRVNIDHLKKVKWLTVILDEGQQIKNPDSQAARASRMLQAEHRLVLTGTPIENRLLDLWSLMAFAMPGVLGDRRYFREHFDRRKNANAQTRLSALLRPFLLRRTKGQVAMDLPPRMEEDVFCNLEDEQLALYNEEMARIRAVVTGSQNDESLRKNSFVILQGLMRLRQICCHPALINPDLIGAQSAKMTALFYLIEQLQDEGHKVLVFSQFTSMLDIIEKRLQEEHRPYTMLTGKTQNRHEVVDRFQRGKDPTCFLLSLKAGGSGLNLTAASYVILYDPWWNPAVENQAIDRTHRIGQVNRVMAYRLLMRDSVEEKIRTLQRTKSAMASGILGEESFTRSLERKDLEFLFGENSLLPGTGRER